MQTVDDDALLDSLLKRAKAQGADAAEAMLVRGVALSHAQRLGKAERLEREESRDLGLRVLIGHSQAFVSTTDTTPAAVDELVARGVAMARAVPADPWCGLADPQQLAPSVPEVDSFDPREPAAESLIEQATRCEEAARAVAGVTNSEGAEAGWSATQVSLAGSNGFAGSYAVSRHSLSVSVLAGEGLGMERDYDFTSAVFAEDLDDPEAVGRRAGERAVRRLTPGRLRTERLPVVFDPRVSNSLLRHLVGAVLGPAVARKTSFLKDKLGERILPAGMAVIDEPHRRRGLRSRPFDAEGLPTRRTALVEDGVLQTWLLDLASARQLGLAPTGHATRGVSGPPSPSPSNLYLMPGTLSPAALIGEIERGFYVTEMIGMGVNGLTGDYSRGASGFLIEKGELTRPITEATIAGNLKQMFLAMTAADDLVFRYGTDAPTLRVDGMTIAGN